MDRTDIINKYIDKYQYKTYLEIGVGNGNNFENIKCMNKISVDPNDEYVNTTFRITSDDFFKLIQPKLNSKYDIIFIDGLHECEQVKRDILNSINYLNANGTIIMHDCNPPTEAHQIVPRIQSDWNGDVWKAFVFYKMKYDWEMFVIDTDWGCGVVRLNEESIFSKKCELIGELNYNFLNKNRNQLLKLITVDKFNQYML